MSTQYFILVLLFVVPIGLGRRTVPWNNQTADFAIYLLRDTALETEQAQRLRLDELTLRAKPFVGIDDIESYEWSTHMITLTADGMTKLKALSDNGKPTSGFPFVVVVGNKTIYLGNISRPKSSFAPGDLPSLFIRPGSSLEISRAPDKRIEDKRNDPRVFKALLTRRKLKC